MVITGPDKLSLKMALIYKIVINNFRTTLLRGKVGDRSKRSKVGCGNDPEKRKAFEKFGSRERGDRMGKGKEVD